VIVDALPDEDITKKIKALLPEQLVKDEYIDVGGILDKNDDNVRIIVFGASIGNFPDRLKKYNDKKVSGIWIDTNNAPKANELSGSITFYKKKGTNWVPSPQSAYLGMPALIGAIFSDDYENYKCAMDKAFDKYNLVTQVYYDRSVDLKVFYNPNMAVNPHKDPTCYQYHKTTTDNAGELDIIKSNSDVFTKAKIVIITPKIGSLKSLNNRAELASCILIY
jgi:hypothetical protein